MVKLANGIVCDKCGRFFEGNPELHHVADATTGQTLHLCSGCYGNYITQTQV
jgi:hypothetical protein